MQNEDSRFDHLATGQPHIEKKNVVVNVIKCWVESHQRHPIRRTVCVALVLLMLTCYVTSTAQTIPVAQVDSLVITNATVLDMTGERPRRNMTIVVRGERIAAIGAPGKVTIPANATMVNAAGKFLIPGLWDMHVHAWDANVFYPVLLANGVTGIRDMGDKLETLVRYRREIESGARLGPRLFFAGQIIDGLRRDNVPFLFSYAGSAEDGRRLVRDRKKGGADFIKVYSDLAPDVYFAIAAEARRENLTFAGHTPLRVGAAAASDAGQHSIEHLTGIALACSTREQQLAAELAQTLKEQSVLEVERAQAEGEKKNELTTRVFALMGRARILADEAGLETYSNRKAAQLFARFRRNGTWQSPTLVIDGNAVRPDRNRLDEERLKYFPPFVRQLIRPATAPEETTEVRRHQAAEIRIVRDMHKAGVRLLAGSDAPNPNSYPGFSLHDELEFLVAAGLTPAEVLRVATRDAAEFLGVLDQLGTIEKGKLADLVLLDANPLTDIRHTQRINAVVTRGRLLDRNTLDRLLTEAAVRAIKKQGQE